MFFWTCSFFCFRYILWSVGWLNSTFCTDCQCLERTNPTGFPVTDTLTPLKDWDFCFYLGTCDMDCHKCCTCIHVHTDVPSNTTNSSKSLLVYWDCLTSVRGTNLVQAFMFHKVWFTFPLAPPANYYLSTEISWDTGLHVVQSFVPPYMYLTKALIF